MICCSHIPLVHFSYGIMMYEVYTHKKHVVPRDLRDLAFQVRPDILEFWGSTTRFDLVVQFLCCQFGLSSSWIRAKASVVIVCLFW